MHTRARLNVLVEEQVLPNDTFINNIKFNFRYMFQPEKFELFGKNAIRDLASNWVYFNVQISELGGILSYVELIDKQVWCVFKKLLYVDIDRCTLYCPALNNSCRLSLDDLRILSNNQFRFVVSSKKTAIHLLNMNVSPLKICIKEFVASEHSRLINDMTWVL